MERNFGPRSCSYTSPFQIVLRHSRLWKTSPATSGRPRSVHKDEDQHPQLPNERYWNNVATGCSTWKAKAHSHSLNCRKHHVTCTKWRSPQRTTRFQPRWTMVQSRPYSRGAWLLYRHLLYYLLLWRIHYTDDVLPTIGRVRLQGSKDQWNH